MTSALTLQIKNGTTFKFFLKKGYNPTLDDMQNEVFTDVVFQDGTQLKDVTFGQFVNTLWSMQTKNNATFTFQNKN